MTAPVLHFDEATHEYRFHDPAAPAVWGKVVPSVTQILHAVGIIDDTWFKEEHRIRGRYVHRMILYEERQVLDERTVDPRLRGYLEAYRRFIAEHEPGPCLLIEQPLADPVLGYAGTPDQVRILRNDHSLIDHKTGISLPWHPIQTAAYNVLVREQATIWPADQAVPIPKRYGLYLHKDGKYDLHQHTDNPRDWKRFKAALTIAKFKETM